MYKSILEAIDPLDAVDHYKILHFSMYPKGLTKVYSNFTPRSAKYFDAAPDFDNKVVVAGMQGFIKWFLIKHWNDNFFNLPIDTVIERYKRRYGNSLGPDAIKDVSHIEKLHALGYLPLEIKCIEEGSRVNIQTPIFTVTNTHPDFAFLPNFLETCLSCENWKVMTTATTLFEFRKILERFAKETGAPKEFIQFQAHCFALRGLSGIVDGATSGFGNLLSFSGTDTVPAIGYAEAYYNADVTKELVGCSVPATEHSIMTSYGEENELDAFRRLITEIHPKGIISIVSDSFSYWDVITKFTVELKDIILARDGTLTFRPDSGCPIRICAGYRSR